MPRTSRPAARERVRSRARRRAARPTARGRRPESGRGRRARSRAIARAQAAPGRVRRARRSRASPARAAPRTRRAPRGRRVRRARTSRGAVRLPRATVGLVRIDLVARESDRSPRTRDREPQVRAGDRAESAHRDFDHGGPFRVADQPVRRARRPRSSAPDGATPSAMRRRAGPGPGSSRAARARATRDRRCRAGSARDHPAREASPGAGVRSDARAAGDLGRTAPEPHARSRGEQGRGCRIRIEERRRGRADQAPPARSLARIRAGELAGQTHGARAARACAGSAAAARRRASPR